MGFIRGIIGLVVAILFTIFAVANRAPVDIVWSPFYPAIPVPVYVVALGMLAFGFFLGSFMAWLNSLPIRFEKSRQKRQIKKLEKELIKKSSTESPLQPATDWNSTKISPFEDPKAQLDKPARKTAL